MIDGLGDYSEKVNKYLHDLDKQGEEIICLGENNSNSQVSAATRTVSGYIKWTDENGNIHPAQGINVQIYKGTGSITSMSLYSTVTTSSTGYYSTSFSYDTTIPMVRIKVLSSGTNINIVNQTNSIYTYESSVSGASSNLTINYTAGNSTLVGKSVSVHQSMALANRYMKSLIGNYLNTINVRFYSTTETSAYYDSGSYIIYNVRDAFDWDVAMHEYGHYVQYIYGIINSPHLSHSHVQNLTDVYGNKLNGIITAWGEGWATYFAINLQKQMNAQTLNVPYVGDTFYQDYDDTFIEYDIENLPVNLRRGEANEATVSAVLYDITDPVNSSEGDLISCSNSIIWNITKNNGCKTLSEFVGALNYSSQITKDIKVKLGSTLSRYNVSARLDSVQTSGTQETFSWTKQGGSSEKPNNSFRLVIFDPSYNVIYSTSYANTTYQSMSLSQWNALLSQYFQLHCCIETRQTDSPVTGSYYSNFITRN